jgi:PilZ domain-containing protein
MNLSTLTSRVGEIFAAGLAGLFTDDSHSAGDRRAYTRMKTRFEGSIDLEGQRISVCGIDLHRAGAGIRSEAPLPVGALVFFYGKTHRLMGWATVRWCSPQSGSKFCAGLEFRSALMRAEAGSWQFSYVRSPEGATGIPVSRI